MPNNIDAAFCSSVANECYVFVKDKYVVVNYAPGAKKKDIIKGPENIADGFPMFSKTLFQYEIDSSFDTGNNVAYFFAGDRCAKTEYYPHSPAKARLLQAPTPINVMFPCLKGTVFESGIDATMRCPNSSWVYLFKGDDTGALDFNRNTLIEREKICKHIRFRPLLGTVFEGGIDAAFNFHVGDEVFIFKGKYYAHYDIIKCQYVNGFVKLISDDWPALQSIL